MSAPRRGFCVFCDDIRHEVGNKISLMGIYHGEIVFSQNPPAILPKFVIAMWLLADVDDPIKQINVSIFGPPARTELAKIEAQPPPSMLPTPPDATQKHIHLVFPMVNFHFPEEGLLEVEVTTERETFRAGRLAVKFAPLHEVFQPIEPTPPAKTS